MSDSPNGAALGLVHEDSEPSEVDESQLHRQVAASEERIAQLERELGEAADEEAETARQLDTGRTRRAALDQQLREAREEATRFRLDEATRTRDAMAAEAEALLETSRIEAEREASRVKRQTFDQAKEMLTVAEREAAAIVDAGREEFGVLEADATRRVDDLETKRQELAHRLAAMETLYNELQETLRLVAETSVKELAETQESLKQLDPAATQGPPPSESTGDHTTSDSAPEEGSVADQEAPSDLEGIDPASIEIPALSPEMSRPRLEAAGNMDGSPRRAG